MSLEHLIGGGIGEDAVEEKGEIDEEDDGDDK